MKRKKRKAREWWMAINTTFRQGAAFDNEVAASISPILNLPDSEVIHVREVLKKMERKR